MNFVSGTTVVAMKTLKESSADKKDLLHELAVMKMLEPHPNVVKLLGCCTDKGMMHAF
jgi:fibroblast growth factor receptor 1